MRKLTIQDVTDWHNKSQIKFLKIEEAICYIVAQTLDSGDAGTYGTGLINKVPDGYKLSDTILYRAIEFILAHNLLTVKTTQVPGRGRPRNIFKINRQELAQCRKLAKLSKLFDS